LKVNPIIPAIFSTFLFFACSSRPSYVLSESKMEKVLYDMYIAEAEINANYSVFSSDSARKQELLNSVLKKHKITEAALDTSLAWYSGQLETYLKINENVSKHYTETLNKLNSQQGGMAIRPNSNGNNLFLPVKEERFLLRPYDLANNTYTFKADTTLNRYGGAYELKFNILGIPASVKPVVALYLRCADTTLVKFDTIRRNGLFESSIDVVKGKQSKSLSGSISFPQAGSETTIFIHDFTLSHSNRALSVAQPTK